jgi:hypothetical protein
MYAIYAVYTTRIPVSNSCRINSPADGCVWAANSPQPDLRTAPLCPKLDFTWANKVGLCLPAITLNWTCAAD